MSTAIRVEALGKRYRVWTHARPTNLTERINVAVRSVAHLVGAGERTSVRQDIWALRDVSFDVSTGEVLGVLGPNGAGKSTLLSILARITEPTEGSAEIDGRVSSLLEVGTGFHPELSGRDNVFLNGAILGMSRAETADKFDEIVDFSGVREFIDIPVKRYSTGMYVRLAFAVAAHLDPEILLLDEVLSVGDRSFQDKCLRRIEEITRSGRTVLFVSHDVNSVARLCSRAIVLRGGTVEYSGDVDGAIDAYLGSRPSLGDDPPPLDAVEREGTGELRVRVTARNAEGGPQLHADHPIVFDLHVDARRPVSTRNLHVRLDVTNSLGGHFVGLSTFFEPDNPLRDLDAIESGTTISCVVDELPLRPGTYRISATVERLNEVLDRAPNVLEFTILPSDFFGTGVFPPENQPPVLVRHRWRVSEMSTVPAPR